MDELVIMDELDDTLCSTMSLDVELQEDFSSASDNFHVNPDSFQPSSRMDCHTNEKKDNSRNFISSSRKSSHSVSTDYDDCPTDDHNINNSEWINNPLFARYWRTYDRCWDWYEFHQSVRKDIMMNSCNKNYIPSEREYYNSYQPCSSMRKDNNPYVNLINSPRLCMKGCSYYDSYYSSSCCCEIDKNNANGTNVNKSKRNKKKKRKHKKKNKKNNSSSTTILKDVEDEMEFVVPEFMEFLLASAQHRKERDGNRNATSKSESSKQANMHNKESVHMKERTTEAPQVKPGSKRLTEIKILYGKDAQIIHGMETAMQLDFERNCDLKQPKFWPNLPLKFQ